MKKLHYRFFIYFITASIFISGNGVVLAFHTCLSSAEKNISFFQESSCCSKQDKQCESECNNKKESISLKCCTSEVSYHKLNAPFLLQKTLEIPEINFIGLCDFSINVLVYGQTIYFNLFSTAIIFSIPIMHHQLLI